MDIKQTGSMVDVSGVIKTVNDSQLLVSAIKDAARNGSVVVRINDSFSLPSTVIGELLKLKDSGSAITIEVHDQILYELLDDLNLVSKFNVKLI